MKWIATQKFSRLIPNTIVPIILFSPFAWWSGYIVQPRVIDPESIDNKCIRISKVLDPLERKGNFAVLIEYGVTSVPTDGINAIINTASKWVYLDKWYGRPNNTSKQYGFAMIESHFVNKCDENCGPSYVVSIDNFSVTPNKSFYLYIESTVPIEITGLGYVALSSNMILPEMRLNKIAKQFRVLDN